MTYQRVVIHCQPSALIRVQENELEWKYSDEFGMNELDVIVEDVVHLDDEEFVSYYGLDYDKVNRIEALNFCAI
tara:strand:- start:905 stop:1126 length:222 start_codon:yes stop_codon:yes gene_type:complete